MLEWLKNLTAGVTIKNRTGLDRAMVELLKEDFTKLDSKSPDISYRLLRYALDGEGEEVLLELGGIKEAGSKLKLLSCYFTFGNKTPSNWKKFFSSIDHNDAEFFLRLAKIYDTARRTEAIYLANSGSGIEWLDPFLQEAVQFGAREIKPRITITLVEEMIVANGQSADSLVRHTFLDNTMAWRYSKPLYGILPGFAESIVRHAHIAIEALAHSDFNVRSNALEVLAKFQASLDPFAEQIVTLAVSSSKQVRAAAEPLLSNIPDSQKLVESKAAGGNNEERFNAARLLWKIAGEKSRAFFEQRVREEKSNKIKAEIQSLIGAAGNVTDSAGDETGFDIPPVAEVDPHAPLGQDFLAALRQCVEEYSAKVEDLFKKNAQYFKGMNYKRKITSDEVEEIFLLLQTMQAGSKKHRKILRDLYATDDILKPFKKLVLHSEVRLIHVIRLMVLLNMIGREDSHLYYFSFGYEFIDCFAQARNSSVSLRELAAGFRAVGIDDKAIGISILESSRWVRSPYWDNPPDQLWPYFAERLDLIEEALGLKKSSCEKAYGDYLDPERRRNAMKILAMMPRLPGQFHQMMWEIALPGGKSERSYAQKCVEKIPGFEKKVIQSLASGQQETRAVAAEWLARLQSSEAIEPLLAALKKEKRDPVKAAFMQALESLGASIDQFMNRAQLEKEAEKETSKIPAALSWFPLGSLPPVAWEDTAERVSPSVIKWLIVKAYKLKSPEPDPLLRRYSAGFRKADREALGKMILEAWMTQDTLPRYDRDDADKRAQQFVSQYGQWYQGQAAQDLYQTMFNHYLNECLSSAIGEKGILAVVAACAGFDAVAIVERYIRQWRGHRIHQCKALVQVLAWIDHASAIQLLLSVANRFRTKGIQEEASRLVNVIAERKGWTLDELADRTIPTAGFDETGALELDYGLRKFYARLGEGFSITLTNEEGKEIKSLPDAAKAEDAQMVKEAKQSLSASRKELKMILKLQRDRLYEAMCVGREWKFADWDQFLNRHPIVGRYCQSLVWGVFEGNSLIASFRPLADRTLTDNQDNPVDVAPDARVRLVHDCNMTDKDRALWAEHFADYKVTSLFEQFGKPTYRLIEGMEEATEISDFEGHLIEAFKLRGQATKLGYVRGEAQDGGWFYTYEKTFITLGLQATIEFTGNGLPEENRTVALVKFQFLRKTPDADYLRSHQPIRLGEIPAILLSECWNDLRSIAGQGSGFDTDWQKKSSY